MASFVNRFGHYSALKISIPGIKNKEYRIFCRIILIFRCSRIIVNFFHDSG